MTPGKEYTHAAKCDRCGCTRPVKYLLVNPGQTTCKDPDVCARMKLAVIEASKVQPKP